MPKLAAVQPQWRSRRDAIGKKGAVDYELLMESEVDFTIAGKERNTVTNSPTSIDSTHLEFAPEMKPLPGAWVTVGKGGRPVSLMYKSATVLSTLNPRAAEFLPAYYAIEDSSNEAKHGAIAFTSTHAAWLPHAASLHMCPPYSFTNVARG